MSTKKEVAVIMGSMSDMDKMNDAIEILKEFNIDPLVQIVSAHRTPEMMVEFAKSAKDQGIKVIIAGAGGAAHLPGMVASLTSLPVIGVPVALKYLDGMDSLLSIVQMPRGVPVATVAVNNSQNAGLLALRMLGISDEKISTKLDQYREGLKNKVENWNKDL
jgi:5-(carboxyamino)imidazole ribonucleotide mutase